MVLHGSMASEDEGDTKGPLLLLSHGTPMKPLDILPFCIFVSPGYSNDPEGDMEYYSDMASFFCAC